MHSSPPDFLEQLNAVDGIAEKEFVYSSIVGVLKELTIKEWKKGEHFYTGIGRIRDSQAIVSEHDRHRTWLIGRSPPPVWRTGCG